LLPTYFDTKGFIQWEKGRRQWLTQNNNSKTSSTSTGTGTGTGSDTSITPQKRGAIDLNVDEVIDCIVSNRWRSAVKGGKDKAMFPHPVPLPQMIDILSDLWEAEGLDV
jgi:hypothetical protein